MTSDSKVQSPQALETNGLERPVAVHGTCAAGCCPSPREHYKSLAFVDHGSGSYHTRDRELAKDRDAYKRLRQDGLQPKRVDGSHRLEALAKTSDHVERGI